MTDIIQKTYERKQKMETKIENKNKNQRNESELTEKIKCELDLKNFSVRARRLKNFVNEIASKYGEDPIKTLEKIDVVKTTDRYYLSRNARFHDEAVFIGAENFGSQRKYKLYCLYYVDVLGVK